MVGQGGRLHLSRVVTYLNGLPTGTKRRLGVDRANGITRRQVENLYGLVAEVLSAPGHDHYDNFDELCHRIVSVSAHAGARATPSVAIDGTSVDSWGTRRMVKSMLPGVRATQKNTDPDAAWRGKGPDAWKRPVFGYDLTLGVSIPEVNGSAVPLGAKSMRLRPAGRETMSAALSVVDDIAQDQGTLGDVLADREYTKSIDGTDFILPVRALGGDVVLQLTQNQIGARGTQRGALIIDGQPFSPSLPPKLHLIAPPSVNAERAEVINYQKQIEDRSKYAMVPHGARKANGAQVYKCPAAAGKLMCPLVASSQNLARGTMPALLAPKNPMPKTVCTKSYTTFAAIEIPLAQRHLHGSRDWFFSVSRRNRVEGFFGNLKDSARENLNRGTIRVRGLVKTGIMVAFAVASVNMRLAVKWDSEQHHAPKPKVGRPRKIGVTTYAQVLVALGANAPPIAS
jgi:hypothetical protein